MTLDEIKKDKAICEAATPEWRQAHHVREPKGITSARDMGMSLLALDRDGMAIFDREADACAAVNAVNRLPVYIAEAEESQRRLAEVKDAADKAEIAARRHAEMSEQAGAEREAARASALRWALKTMRG